MKKQRILISIITIITGLFMLFIVGDIGYMRIATLIGCSLTLSGLILLYLSIKYKEDVSEYKYSVSITVTDNETTNTSQIYIEDDDIVDLSHSSSRFITASSTLVNMGKDELNELSKSIKIDYDKHMSIKSPLEDETNSK